MGIKIDKKGEEPSYRQAYTWLSQHETCLSVSIYFPHP